MNVVPPVFLLFLFLVSLPLQGVLAAEKLSPKQYEEKAQIRIKTWKMAKGLKAELWADESQTKNPSAMSFDSKGRLLICEIDRWRFGVDDIRQRPYMMFEDLMINSNADRLKMFKNHLDKHNMKWYTDKSDRIRLVEDTDGDGRADSSKVFADGFNNALDGPGIGVIERDNKVYYTNIPHLWMLEDTDGDGVADKRKSLQDGFGIRMSFSGHDMHGLVWGPDGKLYWSIGDRGYSIKTKEGKVYHRPNEGAVFRCDPDGSNLEEFYRGLRNPQELQFDEFGNLFTADNDGDGGDIERINYLVEGGDSGWTAGHQTIMSFTSNYYLRSYKYGDRSQKLPNPWMTEDMWKVRNDNQPAFMLPGIGQINGGPSGFLYNPGTSMGEKYDKKFFVIHYKGSPTASYISMFNTEDDGAGFKKVKHERFLSGSNCVDIEFGPDGRMYMSEFNYGGWFIQNVGNIYALSVPEALQKSDVKLNHKLLLADFSQYKTAELAEALGSNHMQVRLKAQFELAKRGNEGTNTFFKLAYGLQQPIHSRVHGIWGIGQMAQKHSTLVEALIPLLKDKEEQVRIQSARVLGDHRCPKAASELVKALKDKNSRVAMYAGIALHRLKYAAVPQVIAAIRKNDGKDLFLRHGLVMALAGLNKSHYISYAKDKSPEVRLSVLLALRKSADKEIASFLSDGSEKVRFEAIRAINDLPIVAATDELAKELDRYLPGKKFTAPANAVEEFMHHRIINANYNSATSEAAVRLLSYASNPQVPEGLRREALSAIEGWGDRHPVDTTTGKPRALATNRANIKKVVADNLGKVFNSAKGNVLAQTTRIALKYDYEVKDEVLMTQIKNGSLPVEVRLESLKSLSAKKAPGLAPVLKGLLKDKDQQFRSLAHKVLLDLEPQSGISALLLLAKKGTTKDKQHAFRLLGAHAGEEIKRLFVKHLDDLMAKKGDPKVYLDVIEGAKTSPVTEVKAKLADYEKSIPSDNIMAKFRPTLMGGDIARGKDVFLNHGVAQCVRCHKIQNFGADVGPNLSTIGKHKDNRYILEGIVDPGAVVAMGYGTVMATLNSGEVVSGVLVGEDKNKIVVKFPDGKEKSYQKSSIKSMNPPVSGMPPMHLLLKPGEIRDLVAYLSSLKGRKRNKPKKGEH